MKLFSLTFVLENTPSLSKETMFLENIWVKKERLALTVIGFLFVFLLAQIDKKVFASPVSLPSSVNAPVYSLTKGVLSNDNLTSINFEPPKPVKKKEVFLPQPKRIIPISPGAAAVPGDLEKWFEEYGSRFGIDKQKLKRIAACESGFHPNSINPSGPYLGMFQYVESTWVATRRAMGENPDPQLVFNPEEAIKTSAWKIAHGGIDAWPVCGKL